MTTIHITFNSNSHSGTATINGQSSLWRSSEAGNITVAGRLPLVTKAQVVGAIRRAGNERMEPVRAAIKQHGYCSPEHYAALDSIRDTFDITV